MQAWFRNVPDVSKCTFGVCVTLAALQWLSIVDVARLGCLSVQHITKRLQLHRVLLAHVAHAGPLHLALNMVAFLSLAPHVEHAAGSVRFGCAIAPLLAHVLKYSTHGQAVKCLT